MLVELAIEVPFADAEHAGGTLAVPVRGGQDTLDVLALEGP
jgi:hypothetical protein